MASLVLNLADDELDRPIYRIMRADYVYALFASGQNVLNQLHNWKDKFENFQRVLGRSIGSHNGGPDIWNAFVGQCWTRNALSEAMWGIYANNSDTKFLRLRSTPRKLIDALDAAHCQVTHPCCFVGKVAYKREHQLETYCRAAVKSEFSPAYYAESLLLKRRAFRHEREIRLLFFGNANDYGEDGLYRYEVDPHRMITQIMADPNRDRRNWQYDKAEILAATRFSGPIKRSKIYDPPEWKGLPMAYDKESEETV